MTALCTITGGLAAVIYTEMIQCLIMVGGGLTLMGFAFKEIGGYENLYIKYMQAIPESNLTNSTNQTSKYLECGMPKENSFQILRDISDKEMPWLGFIIGQTPTSIWYWCNDQVRIHYYLIIIYTNFKNTKLDDGSTYISCKKPITCTGWHIICWLY